MTYYIGSRLSVAFVIDKGSYIFEYNSPKAATVHQIAYRFNLTYPSFTIYNKATGSLLMPSAVEATPGNLRLVFTSPYDIFVTLSLTRQRLP